MKQKNWEVAEILQMLLLEYWLGHTEALMLGIATDAAASAEDCRCL